MFSGAANTIAVEDGRDDANEVNTVLRNPFERRTRLPRQLLGRIPGTEITIDVLREGELIATRRRGKDDGV